MFSYSFKAFYIPSPPCLDHSPFLHLFLPRQTIFILLSLSFCLCFSLLIRPPLLAAAPRLYPGLPFSHICPSRWALPVSCLLAILHFLQSFALWTKVGNTILGQQKSPWGWLLTFGTLAVSLLISCSHLCGDIFSRWDVYACLRADMQNN